jgi:hypothetical protein
MTKTIKLTTPWQHNYQAQIPENAGIKFEVNNMCHEADFWFIWGGLTDKESVKCPKENIIYITDEAHELRIYNHQFLNQFKTIASVRKDLQHPNSIYIHEPQIWYFDKTRTELDQMQLIEKKDTISVVASDLTLLPGHKQRFAFVNKMIGHFKDKLHVYGRGFNPVADKWQAIAPYKYSLAIENNVIPNYFTEKLTECYLSYTMPVYYGCPNIKEYFTPDSYIQIDINDYKKSIHIIEKAIEENWWEKNFQHIEDARKQVLNRYHVFALIPEIIKQLNSGSGKGQLTTIYPEHYFVQNEEQQELINKMSSQGLRLPLKILGKAILNRLK